MSPDRKVAVITGASKGIGAALVKAYRDCGYRVVATALAFEASIDDDVVFVPGDIADRKIAQRSISEGVARFGRTDTLINNAGIFISKAFTEYTEADYAAIVGVNLTGFFHITQCVVAEMERPCRPDHDELGRARKLKCTVGPRFLDQGAASVPRPNPLPSSTPSVESG
jgi:NAD(P)-dependent dehydrogenase (short-subunit alcohol dehydrogenase family)